MIGSLLSSRPILGKDFIKGSTFEEVFKEGGKFNENSDQATFAEDLKDIMWFGGYVKGMVKEAEEEGHATWHR